MRGTPLVLALGLLGGRPVVEIGPQVAQVRLEERVTVASGAWRLVGDFMRPPGSEPRPTALLLNQAAGNREAYGELAHALADRGIASLRLDLRGHGESVGQGRFTPGASGRDPLIWDADADVVAAFAYLRSRPDVDAERLAVVGASYSGEESVEAGRSDGFAAAYVLLSPGSLSAESVAALVSSETPWMLVFAEDDPFLREIVTMASREAPGADILTLPGGGHATDLLAARPELAARVAGWLAAALTAPPS